MGRDNMGTIDMRNETNKGLKIEIALHHNATPLGRSGHNEGPPGTNVITWVPKLMQLGLGAPKDIQIVTEHPKPLSADPQAGQERAQGQNRLASRAWERTGGGGAAETQARGAGQWP